MKRWPALILASVFILGLAIYFDVAVQNEPNYLGVPAVPCIDPTLPILRRLTFTVRLTIKGRAVQIPATIGHDPGQCLRVMHTDDASGKVTIQSNDVYGYTLGDFFETWGKIFNAKQVFNYEAENGHHIDVRVNGKPVDTYDATPIMPNAVIEVDYY